MRVHRVVLVALAVFVGVIASDTSAHVYGWGLNTVVWVQSALVSGPMTLVARSASAGGFEAFIVLVPALIWTRGTWGISLGVSLLSLLHYSLLFVSLAKTYFQEPRPIHLLAATASPAQSGSADGASHLDAVEYSFPSGHSWATTVAWLVIVDALAASSRIRLIRVLAVLCVAATAGSRVYFALHFVHDVLAGIALGVLTFAARRVWLDPGYTLVRTLVISVSAAVLLVAFDVRDRVKQLGAWYSLGALAMLAIGNVLPLSPIDPTVVLPPSPFRASVARVIVGLVPMAVGLALLLSRVKNGARDAELEAIMLFTGAVASGWVVFGAQRVFNALGL